MRQKHPLTPPSGSRRNSVSGIPPSPTQQPLLSKLPVIRLGDYSDVHEGVVAGIDHSDHAEKNEALAEYCRAIGRHIDFRHDSPKSIAKQAEQALLEHNDPASCGEAILEAANLFHQTDPARVIPTYNMLHNHVDKLYDLSKSAPSYNLACCYLNLKQADDSAGNFRLAKEWLLKSVRVSIDVGDKEDLRSTVAILRNNDSDTVVLQKKAAEWIQGVIDVLQQAVSDPANGDRLEASLKNLAAQI
jgi:hypothetical protein